MRTSSLRGDHLLRSLNRVESIVATGRSQKEKVSAMGHSLWYGHHMEYFLTASQAHRNKERIRARELRRSQWWRLKLAQGLCFHCNKKFAPSELTMDHLIPVARGGRSTKGNIVVACKQCNSQKKYYTPVDLILEDLVPDSRKQTICEES